jgi:hypothetical protein
MNSTVVERTMAPGTLALWRAAQGVGVVATIALLVALLRVPDTALRVLWDVAIPVLPAAFLVNPALWRNVCPLATINTLLSRFGQRRVLDERLIPSAGIVGILLLALMVPARRFLFNGDGTVLALTIVVVAVLALVLGAFFDKKAGFCSSICPVLPVEKLYGQGPLFAVSNPRCLPCTMCTARGCPDVAHSKSVAQTLGRTRRSHAWLATGYGAFAAGFPGFVIGYNMTQDGALETAGSVYLTVALWALASYVITQLAVRALKLSAVVSVRLLGALALMLYYWFAATVVTDHLALADWAPTAIRTIAVGLVAWWLWRMDWSAAGPGREASIPA